jgi:hypothetical protein
VIGIADIVGKPLDDLEQIGNKAIIHVQKVLSAQTLHPRHLVHDLQKQAMQSRIVVTASIDQLNQSREAVLVDHARKRCLLRATIKKQEAGDDMQRPRLVFL